MKKAEGGVVASNSVNIIVTAIPWKKRLKTTGLSGSCSDTPTSKCTPPTWREKHAYKMS